MFFIISDFLTFSSVLLLCRSIEQWRFLIGLVRLNGYSPWRQFCYITTHKPSSFSFDLLLFPFCFALLCVLLGFDKELVSFWWYLVFRFHSVIFDSRSIIIFVCFSPFLNFCCFDGRWLNLFWQAYVWLMIFIMRIKSNLLYEALIFHSDLLDFSWSKIILTDDSDFICIFNFFIVMVDD